MMIPGERGQGKARLGLKWPKFVERLQCMEELSWSSLPPRTMSAWSKGCSGSDRNSATCWKCVDDWRCARGDTGLVLFNTCTRTEYCSPTARAPQGEGGSARGRPDLNADVGLNRFTHMPRDKLRFRGEVVDSVTWHAIQLAICRRPSATTQALLHLMCSKPLDSYTWKPFSR